MIRLIAGLFCLLALNADGQYFGSFAGAFIGDGASITNIHGDNVNAVYSSNLRATTNSGQVTVLASNSVIIAGSNITVTTNALSGGENDYTIAGTSSTGIATNSGTGTNNVFTSPTIINLGLVRQDASHGVIPIRFDPSGAFVEVGTNNTYSGSVAGMVTVFGVSNSIANTASESFILGYSNVINGGASHSVAMGSYGTINNNHSGTFLFSDLSSTSQFVSPAANTFNIRATGGVNIQAGTSAGNARAGGDLKVSTTTTGNVAGGEDNLITYSVPASTLSANGQYIEYDCWGYFTNNANAKDLKIYFGATAIFDSTALVLNGVAWRGHGKVVRTGAATQTATCEFTIGGTLLGAVTTTTTQLSSPAETLSGAVTFKVTGTDSGLTPVDNSIVQVAQVIKWGQGQ